MARLKIPLISIPNVDKITEDSCCKNKYSGEHQTWHNGRGCSLDLYKFLITCQCKAHPLPKYSPRLLVTKSYCALGKVGPWEHGTASWRSLEKTVLQYYMYATSQANVTMASASAS